MVNKFTSELGPGVANYLGKFAKRVTSRMKGQSRNACTARNCTKRGYEARCTLWCDRVAGRRAYDYVCTRRCYALRSLVSHCAAVRGIPIAECGFTWAVDRAVGRAASPDRAVCLSPCLPRRNNSPHARIPRAFILAYRSGVSDVSPLIAAVTLLRRLVYWAKDRARCRIHRVCVCTSV